jgi:deoxyribodipyrimidine photo-lyase
MCWGKKILEWSHTPEKVFDATLAIMNKYFLDARDPNAYSNVGWLFGLHDRPWATRPIFGTIRYMSASGLERKCDIGAYVEKVDGYAESQHDHRKSRWSMMAFVAIVWHQHQGCSE